VKLFYSSSTVRLAPAGLDLALVDQKFDLPLRKHYVAVYLNEKWHLKKWSGTLHCKKSRQ